MTIVALDFGGTQLRAARFASDMSLLARDSTPSLTHEAQAAVIDRMLNLIRQVWPQDGVVEAIGISAPCPMAYTGLIRHAAVVPDWDDVPLAQIVSQAFDDLPVFMENDANLGALAEYHYQPANPMVYMTISTGIGGGLVIDGELFTGKSGLAIEPGHMKYRDAEGTIRSLQDFASGPGIARLARIYAEFSNESSILRDNEHLTGQMVGEAALAGDVLALRVIEEAAYWLGIGLTNVMHMCNPEQIVLGGSVLQLGDLLLDPARRLMQSLAVDPTFYHDALLRIAHYGDDVCLIGAAVYAWSRLQTRKFKPDVS